jgi:prepilin-type N-terminal cleavage/methylation domain-containing protein
VLPFGPAQRFRPPRRPRGFSLIELLVVIAIVGVTMSILLPALGYARRAAATAADMASLSQVMTGYAVYSNDHRGAVLPGYLPTAWASENPPPGVTPWDIFDNEGVRLHGVRAQRYPWRLAPYFDYNFSALYKDPRLLERYREREDFQYVVSVSPSFGINADFVGGKALPGFGFNPAALRQWGPFYITRIDEARRPDHLVVFASAHGVDPDGGAPVPGYFEVSSPNLLERRWTFEYDAEDPPTVHGNVHARYEGRTMTGQLDGHASLLKMAELDDMRRWSNQATRADWTLGAR